MISHHHRFFRHYFNSKHGITCTNKYAYNGVVETLRTNQIFAFHHLWLYLSKPACVALLTDECLQSLHLRQYQPTYFVTKQAWWKAARLTRSCDVALQHAVIDVPVRPALVDIGISLRRYI